MKRTITLVVVSLLLAMAARAETVRWAIKPEYKKIVRYSNDLFKCQTDNGKYQLVDLTGKKVNHPLADSITDYVGGYALVLNQDGGKLQIVGFFSEQGGHNYQAVNGVYYMARYSFFSEDYIAVADREGKQGFLDVRGQLAIDCKYLEVRPFRFGYSSVVVAKRRDGLYDVNYINKSGSTNGPASFSSQLTYGTTFNDAGVAVVGDHRKYALINSQFKVLKNLNEKPDLADIRASDFSIVTSGNELLTTDDRVVPQSKLTVDIIKVDGLYGYVKSEEVVAPPQFSAAQDFDGEYAIAAIKGRFGVLQMLPGKFRCSWPSEEPLRVYHGLNCDDQHFSISMPEALRSPRLSFDNGDGMVEMKTNDFDFTPVVQQHDAVCRLRAKVVSDDGLLLWEGEKDLKLAFIDVIVGKPAVTSAYADRNGNQTVKTTITNNSSVTVEVSATIKVLGYTNSIKVELGPHQSRDLSVVVKVTDELSGKTQNASVTVKVDGGHYAPGSTSSVKFQKAIQ